MTCKIHKIDNDFCILDEDEEIPAVGQGNYYHRTAKAALEHLARNIVSAGEQLSRYLDEDIRLSDCKIAENEHASADLIRSFGFTVAEK